jgi:hypothetical protein
MDIDFAQLVADIVDAVRGVTRQSFAKVEAFVREQTPRIAMHYKLATELHLAGEVGDAEYREMVKDGELMIRRLGMTIAGLTIVTLERAWNAIVGVVWGTVNRALGAAGVPLLAIPPAPLP